LLNAVSGVVRVFARDRSTGPDRLATGRTNPATARRAHRRAIGIARLLADTLTATPRARARAELHRSGRLENLTHGAVHALGLSPHSELGHGELGHGATGHAETSRPAAIPATIAAAAPTLALLEKVGHEQLAEADRLARPRKRASARRRLYRRGTVIRMTSERALPIAIAMIVVIAAGVSLAPAAAPVGANEISFGGDAAAAAAPRLAVGGGVNGFAEFDGPAVDEEAVAQDAVVDDGTLYKPVAVDTSVKSSADKLEHYTVKEGDTLTSIASRYGVSMMTVWWANKMTSKDDLKVGRELIIPPVSGLVVTVKPGDTLDSIAAENKVTIDEIISTNELDDPNLIVGQVLLLPGAKGEPMPTPKPTPTPTPKPRTSGGGGGGFIPTGGSWAWPVPGGYVSQGFHYGHYGVDIAHDYGSTIVTPRAGEVVFAGWKDNGGGYQVWIYHGNGIYSGHHHMSSVLVRAGQSVSKGQRIGRVGSSGWATGPHDHFEVWVGYPWKSGSYRVNPLKYY
jgi:murein DD-endopeptidase MepM/ murein hydrolase activator NlpD